MAMKNTVYIQWDIKLHFLWRLSIFENPPYTPMGRNSRLSNRFPGSEPTGCWKQNRRWEMAGVTVGKGWPGRLQQPPVGLAWFHFLQIALPR